MGRQLYLKVSTEPKASEKRIHDANDLKHQMEPVLSGFEKFILLGNVADMRVGVVIGAVFSALGVALTKDLLTPLIAALFGKPDFSAIRFTVNNSAFALGDLINNVALVSAAMYFLLLHP